MIVFNRKLRSHKTSTKDRTSAATTALFIRSVETKKIMSLLAGQKGVCL